MTPNRNVGGEEVAQCLTAAAPPIGHVAPIDAPPQAPETEELPAPYPTASWE